MWYDFSTLSNILAKTMKHINDLEFFVQTDIVVVGSNPENADYNNPRGEIHGYRGYIIAEAEDGSRWVFNRTMTSRCESKVVERLEQFISHIKATGRQLSDQYWSGTRPAYGSDAYQRGGWSQLDYEEERMMEEENQW